jgi:hypothetical protein
MCAIATPVQPELALGIIVFGGISLGANVVSQAVRPDPLKAAIDVATQLATDGLPPVVGVPIELWVSEAARQEQMRQQGK